MAGVYEIPLADLAQQCAEETDKYRVRQQSEQLFCFELMRRALAEDVPEAFTYIYRIYEPQVLTWVYRHARFIETDETAEYFAGSALRSFYFRTHGPHFAAFPSLAHLLAYIKRCVHTAIAQYLRDHAQPASISLEIIGDSGQNADLDAGLRAAEVWARIVEVLPDQRDQLLARCALVLGMRPQQTYHDYPDQWSGEREISVALYRIRRTLRRDPQLRQLAGLGDSDDGLIEQSHVG